MSSEYRLRRNSLNDEESTGTFEENNTYSLTCTKNLLIREKNCIDCILSLPFYLNVVKLIYGNNKWDYKYIGINKSMVNFNPKYSNVIPNFHKLGYKTKKIKPAR